MNTILLGNIISFIGCTIMVLIGLIKSKKKILVAQIIQMILQGVANFILGGITGTVSNAISIVRNLYCLKFAFSWPVKIIFIVIQAVFTLLTNDAGFIGWLPFIACLVFILILDSKNEVVLKIAVIIGEACWISYDLFYKNYTACAFDTFTVISTIVGIILILKNKNKEGVEKVL